MKNKKFLTLSNLDNISGTASITILGNDNENYELDCEISEDMLRIVKYLLVKKQLEDIMTKLINDGIMITI